MTQKYSHFFLLSYADKHTGMETLGLSFEYWLLITSKITLQDLIPKFLSQWIRVVIFAFLTCNVVRAMRGHLGGLNLHFKAPQKCN